MSIPQKRCADCQFSVGQKKGLFKVTPFCRKFNHILFTNEAPNCPNFTTWDVTQTRPIASELQPTFPDLPIQSQPLTYGSGKRVRAQWATIKPGGIVVADGIVTIIDVAGKGLLHRVVWEAYGAPSSHLVGFQLYLDGTLFLDDDFTAMWADGYGPGSIGWVLTAYRESDRCCFMFLSPPGLTFDKSVKLTVEAHDTNPQLGECEIDYQSGEIE